MFYPWHESYRLRITRQFEQGRLAHAMLLSGPEHLGKFDFAFDLARLFLCKTDAVSSACGHCASCLLIAAATHPDLRIVRPEDSKQIKIEQVRELIGWVGQTAQRGGLKIAIVNPAEQMNHQSANALLKCLEEPSPNTLIVLCSSRSASLLPTIRSRCQQYSFSTPERQIALSWLAQNTGNKDQLDLLLDIAGGVPLIVSRKYEEAYLGSRNKIVKTLYKLLVEDSDPLECASVLQKLDGVEELDEVLEVMQTLISDCLKLELVGDEKSCKNKDVALEITNIVKSCETSFLFKAFDRIGRDIRALRSTSNPNKSLLLEGLLIDLGTKQDLSFTEYSL